ncbi:T9SS type A sorting domain-containing protein [Taibaiella koreensis]|uniref:T9SS type A sorting domain-containing protein n=1 Tax=Taibaiella koreensis TaxID=1268548 RepID=UPI000E59E4B4|nr:T9SS type A sorting domain-containing protein [Taibaiella koreensis]
MNIKFNLRTMRLGLLFAFAGAMPAVAQDLSFTDAYPSRLPLSRTANNNSNMIITRYYSSTIGTSRSLDYLMASNVTENKLAVKLTALRHDGTLIWSKVYKSEVVGQQRRCFAISYNAQFNSYVLTGYQANLRTNRDDLWLMEVDALGNVIQDFNLSADSIPCSYFPGPGEIGLGSLCTSFRFPSFYGLDILQVKADPDSTQNGDFVVTGFLSDKPSVTEYGTGKRSFVWRFAFDRNPAARSPIKTKYLKVFHGTNTNSDEPNTFDLTSDVEEIPGLGLLLLGHKGGPPRRSIDLNPPLTRHAYYALMHYNGGGSSVVSPTVFSYVYSFDEREANVRSVLGSDGYLYMLGYYHPKKAFTLMQMKPASGAIGFQNVYYTNNTPPLPAFSMYQSQNAPDELVIMGYRVGDDKSMGGDYVHPYTIKVSHSGTLLSNFNLEKIYSAGYSDYAPAGTVDYFRPFENGSLPIASTPNIGFLNRHPEYDDAAVTGALLDTVPAIFPRYHATVSGFRFVTDKAECNPYQQVSLSSQVDLTPSAFKFAINNIKFDIGGNRPTVRIESSYLTCKDITTGEASEAKSGSAKIPASDEVISIYPNPVTNMLHVMVEKKGRYTYSISTVTGTKVASGSFEDRGAIATGELAGGMYFIRVVPAEGAQQVLKFLKQ